MIPPIKHSTGDVHLIDTESVYSYFTSDSRRTEFNSTCPRTSPCSKKRIWSHYLLCPIDPPRRQDLDSRAYKHEELHRPYRPSQFRAAESLLWNRKEPADMSEHVSYIVMLNNLLLHGMVYSESKSLPFWQGNWWVSLEICAAVVLKFNSKHTSIQRAHSDRCLAGRSPWPWPCRL